MRCVHSSNSPASAPRQTTVERHRTQDATWALLCGRNAGVHMTDSSLRSGYSISLSLPCGQLCSAAVQLCSRRLVPSSGAQTVFCPRLVACPFGRLPLWSPAPLVVACYCPVAAGRSSFSASWPPPSVMLMPMLMLMPTLMLPADADADADAPSVMQLLLLMLPCPRSRRASCGTTVCSGGGPASAVMVP